MLRADIEARISANPDDLVLQYIRADRLDTAGRDDEMFELLQEICAKGFEEACHRVRRIEETGTIIRGQDGLGTEQ